MGASEWLLLILKTTLLLKQKKKPTKKPLSPFPKKITKQNPVCSKWRLSKQRHFYMAIVLIFTAYKISNEEDIYEDHIKHTFWLGFSLIH